MEALIATEDQLRKYISINTDLIQRIEDGFSALSAGKVTMPPIMRLDMPEKHAEVDVKTAYIPGLEGFAIKISPGFFNNHTLGLPSTSGLMVLLSAETGFVKAVLLDNGYLTDVRTAGAGAIAAKHLARASIRTVGVIGTGAQARYQIRALRQVRQFKRLLVYGRSETRRTRYINEMREETGIEVIAAESIETLVRQSEVVITTTPAREPLIQAAWLHPGLHITAMGSDAENKQELDADVFARADVIVCDRKAQSFRLGELHHAQNAGVLDETATVLELGEITSGQKAGRTSDDEITICDLTGTGMQDTIIAVHAYHQLLEHGDALRR
ncbi:MAG: cyclodeaminase [Aggregatilineales bacterium]